VKRELLCVALLCLIGNGFCEESSKDKEVTKTETGTTKEKTLNNPPAPSEPLVTSESDRAVVIDEIVVTASRVKESKDRLPQSITVVTQKEMLERSPNVAGESIREEAGVWMPQAFGTRFKYSPVLRGRSTTRYVGFLCNGVRITSALLEQMPFGFIDHVEVVRGPAGAQYGGDFMAGVVNAFTKQAEFTDKGVKFGGEAFGRYGANSNERSEYVNFKISTPNVGAFLGVSNQEFDDFRDTNWDRVNQTGAESTDLYGEIAFKPWKGHVIRLTFNEDRTHDADYYAQSRMNPSGVPRFRRPIEDRNIRMLSWDIEEPLGFINAVHNTAYFHNDDAREVTQTETATNTNRREAVLDAKYFGGSTQATTELKVGKLVYGFDYRLENRRSYGRSFSRVNATGVQTTTSVTGSGLDTDLEVGSAFFLSDWKVLSNFDFSAGVRFETTNFVSFPKREDIISPFTEDDITLDKRWNSVTWHLGGVYDVNKHLSLTGLVGTAFRVPNTGELLTFARLDAATGIIQVPSPQLEPEKAITYQFGPRWNISPFSGAVTVYRTDLKDNIVVQDEGTVTLPGNVTGTARRRTNGGQGYIQGIEAEAAVRLHKEWKLFGHYTLTKGYDTTFDIPLEKIPPANGLIGLRWEREDKYWAETTLQMAARYQHPSPADKTNVQNATDPALGSPNTTTNPRLRRDNDLPGFAALNVRGGATIWQDKESDRKLSGIVSIRNTTNTTYRETFSTLKEQPGIDVSVSLHFKF